jgi:muconolactone delta-isomerase
MLYLLDVDIDYARMGDRVGEIRASEHARVVELIDAGVVVVEWLKANGRGIYAIWDCASHDALRQAIASVPMAPYLSRVDIQPLIAHPLFPGGRPHTAIPE